MKSILDPKFKYTSSVDTDLRKTFARARKQIREKQEQEKNVNWGGKVTPLERKKP